MNQPHFKGLLCALLLLVAFLSPGQTQTFEDQFLNYHSHVIPETPNAASLGQYGDTPVDYSTGVPQISIPLYAVEIDGVQIPISISYHASGIRVSQLASSVGLGWSLNAGGGVFRTVKELPDENGWLSPSLRGNVKAYMDTSNLESYLVHQTISSYISTKDHSPDEFRYSFPSSNGNFYFNEETGTTGLENKLIKEFAEPLMLSPTLINGEFQFDATDASGSSYKLRTKEYNNNTTIIGTVNMPGSVGSISQPSPRTYSPVGWMIDTIVTKNDYEILFEYEEYNFEYTNYQISETIHQPVWCEYKPAGLTGPTHGACGCEGLAPIQSLDYDHYEYKTLTSVTYSPKNQLIKSIETEQVKVSFNYSDNAQAGVWKRQLDQIVITDKTTNKSRGYYFNYGTYTGPSKRLKLTSVQEYGYDGMVKPPFEFSYYAGDLPDLDSRSMDFQGYYNGKTNSSLIRLDATTFFNIEDVNFRPYLANRDVDPFYLKTGTLSSIQYPTHGKSEFLYEPNMIYHVNGTNDEYQSKSIRVSNTLNDSTYIEGANTVHCLFFESGDMLSRFITNFGVSADNYSHEGYSSTCPDETSIDCPRWRIYDVDNQTLIQAEKSVWSAGSASLRDSGEFRLELLIETSELPLSVDEVYVDLSWVEAKHTPHDYAGGMRIKEVKKTNSDGVLISRAIYNYDGLVSDFLTSGDNYTSEGDQDFPKRTFSSDPIRLNGFPTRQGYYYEEVEEILIGSTDSLKTKYFYSNQGLLSKNQAYMDSVKLYANNSIVQMRDMSEVKNERKEMPHYIIGKKDQCIDFFNANENSGLQMGYDSPLLRRKVEFEKVQSRVLTKNYFDSGSIESEETRYLNSNQLDSVIVVTNSEGKVIRTEFSYANELSDLSSLSAKNIVSIPATTKVSVGGVQVGGQALEFDTDGNVVKVYRYNRGFGSNTSPLTYIPSNYELVNEFEIIDGRPIGVTNNSGIETTYVWGYDGKYPVAKIDNASPALVASSLGVTVNDLSSVTTGQLTQLDGLRNTLNNSQISTYKYSEVGLIEIIDPNDVSTHYEKDGLGRLKKIIDDDLNILQAYDYFYYSQPNN